MKPYDYLEAASHLNDHMPRNVRNVAGMKRILRKLVREAVMRIADNDASGVNETYDEMAERIAKEMVP